MTAESNNMCTTGLLLLHWASLDHCIHQDAHSHKPSAKSNNADQTLPRWRLALPDDTIPQQHNAWSLTTKSTREQPEKDDEEPKASIWPQNEIQIRAT